MNVVYTMEQKNTKIICTISDINCETEFIRQLYLNGMNVARINSAHATLDGAQRVVDNIRAVSDKIAILIDSIQLANFRPLVMTTTALT